MARYRHDPSKDLVGFLVGDVMYAVRIDVVREIVNPLPVVELPRAPPTVKGVADYRGEVVPIVDLRERFGLPMATISRRTKWIVLDVGPRRAPPGAAPGSVPGARYAALVVDSVTEVFGLAGGELRPFAPLGAGDAERGIEGVTTLGERLVFVLDARSFGPVIQEVLGGSASAASSGAQIEGAQPRGRT